MWMVICIWTWWYVDQENWKRVEVSYTYSLRVGGIYCLQVHMTSLQITWGGMCIVVKCSPNLLNEVYWQAFYVVVNTIGGCVLETLWRWKIMKVFSWDYKLRCIWNAISYKCVYCLQFFFQYVQQLFEVFTVRLKIT